jgi:hypothetical protein
MDDIDEAAARRELKAGRRGAVALRRGSHRRAPRLLRSAPGGFFFGGRLQLARLSAARRAREVLQAAEGAAAAAALEHGASYPTLADAARTARQTAWKLYRSR